MSRRSEVCDEHGQNIPQNNRRGDNFIEGGRLHNDLKKNVFGGNDAFFNPQTPVLAVKEVSQTYFTNMCGMSMVSP